MNSRPTPHLVTFPLEPFAVLCPPSDHLHYGISGPKVNRVVAALQSAQADQGLHGTAAMRSPSAENAGKRICDAYGFYRASLQRCPLRLRRPWVVGIYLEDKDLGSCRSGSVENANELQHDCCLNPGAATLVTPNGNIGTNHNPTYTWNEVSGSSWYYLW